jgi:hypothetical protein
MTQRWLKHVDDGFIFGFTEGLAAHPRLREVTAEEAFPEKFAPKELVKKATTRKKKLVVTTDDIPEEPEYNNEELNQDASKGLPE